MPRFKEKKEAMQLLTQEYVDKLIEIWRRMFPLDICEDYLHTLVDLATNFYEELINDTLLHKISMENEINNLRKEADRLRQLLKIDVQLPTYDNEPLLTVYTELERILEDYEKQSSLRKEQVNDMLLEQQALCEELGESPHTLLADPLPKDGEIETFRKHLEGLKNERMERMNKMTAMKKDIKHFLLMLELKVSNEHEDRILNNLPFKIDKETLEELERMHNFYGSQAMKLRESIQNVHKKLNTLWDGDQTSPNILDTCKSFSDYNQHTYDILLSELQRCESLKNKNTRHDPNTISDDIEKLEEKTLKSKSQSLFSKLNNTRYKANIQIVYEKELENLKSYYETNKKIFELYAIRNSLWDRMNALEAKANDPERYKNRGGQLLKEEKERRMIKTKLPRIEQEIIELVKKYEEREHAPFLVYGENIIDVMSAQWTQKQLRKESVQSCKMCSARPMVNISKPLCAENTSSVSCLQTTAGIASPYNMSSTQKRELKSNDQNTPISTYPLKRVLHSATILQKQPANETNTKQSTSKKKCNMPGSNLRSKLVATTIRRRSVKYSGCVKKRRSNNKASSSARNIPKIVVERSDSNAYNTNCITGETYDSFKKCIGQTSRSSIIHNLHDRSDSTPMQYNTLAKNIKLAALPKPIINYPLCKQPAIYSNRTLTPTDNIS